MWSKVFVVLVLGVVVSIEANCSPCREAPTHYKELNCTGARNPGDCCDTRWVCPDSVYERPADKCTYHGKWYNVNDKVDGSLLPSCIKEAKCVPSSSGAKFELVREPPVSVEYWCIAQYTLDNMCTPVKKVCETEEKEKLTKCQFGDDVYHEGQLFTSNLGSFVSSACYKCVCDASFDNTTQPSANKNCKKIECGMQLENDQKIRDGCVPVYHTTGMIDYEPTTCCPIDFMCPKTKPKETYTPSQVQPRTCVFGDKTLGLGERVPTEEVCRTCICLTPPALTCIQSPTC